MKQSILRTAFVLAIGAATLLVPMESAAAQTSLYCEAEVEWFSVGKGGDVSVRLNLIRQSSNDELHYATTSGVISPRLCSLDGSWKGTAAGVCNAMLSTITAAELAGKRVRIKFVSLATECSAIPAYSEAPSAEFVKLIK